MSKVRFLQDVIMILSLINYLIFNENLRVNINFQIDFVRHRGILHLPGGSNYRSRPLPI